MFGVFAEFETNLRRERQQEGLASAKARGVWLASARRHASVGKERVAPTRKNLSYREKMKRLPI